MGTCVALPFLDAMVAPFTRAAVSKPPCRMAFVYVPNGVMMEDWLPQTAGESASLPEALPRILEPMASWRERILIVSGWNQNGGRALGDGGGDHARASASYLTAVHPKKTFGAELQAGVSVDQIAAQRVGNQTRFASLELGCEEGLLGGNCDNGYSCAYNNSIAWRTPSSPLPPETRPRAVFERLFGSGHIEQDPKRRARQRADDKSILDFVLEEAHSLQAKLGPADRRKMDEYLFAVRDIETRIEKVERGQGDFVPSIDKPAPGLPADQAEHSRLMFDLLTMAFQSDQTRVATFMLSLEQSNRSYPEIGIPESHHGLSHHQKVREKTEKLVRINRYHMEQFRYFLEKLKAIPDGDGSLLDHSMIMYGSGLADGDRHDHSNLPTLLAGGACGSIRAGRHLRCADNTPMANLFVAMLDRMHVPVEKFGDSRGNLEYLSGLNG
jgi:Protein of unknown function (DUF1552)